MVNHARIAEVGCDLEQLIEHLDDLSVTDLAQVILQHNKKMNTVVQRLWDLLATHIAAQEPSLASALGARVEFEKGAQDHE